MYALLETEADSCPGCGQPLSESGHPDADPRNPDRKYKYQTSNPIVCHSCGALEKAKGRAKSDPRFKDGKAVPMFVTRRIDLTDG